MKSGKIHALRQRGFVLMVSLLLVALFVLTGVGLISLSAITVRQTSTGLDASIARANARTALVQAIGQLQKTMGPDRRVSASADILGDDVAQPFWTGVWRSRPKTEADWLTRDDLNGGLRDSRTTDKTNAAAQSIAWLVSGSGSPLSAPSGGITEMVGKSKTASNPVTVETIAISKGDDVTGHLAWWTGDLGIRANLQVPDAHIEAPISPSAPTADGYARILASQRVDESVATGNKEVSDSSRPLLASDATMALGTGDKAWADDHYLDFTTFSSGVLADINHGGLKKDLTAYFNSDGSIPAKDGLTGISDEDLLAGGEPDDGTNPRHDKTAPRFGLLRNWARSSVPFSGSNVPAVDPETGPTDKNTSSALALCNALSVQLEGNHTAALQPILVEATNYTQISTYPVSPGTYQLRSLLYPRVVLWNPYNVELHTGKSIVVIQGNGRQEMWTESWEGTQLVPTQWLNFEGGRSTSFNIGQDVDSDAGFNDPYIGSYYFSIPETTFAPGECLVFSPARAAEYNGLSAYRPGPYDLSANVLSCTVSPDPSRSYYVSASDIGGAFTFLPVAFWYAPTNYWSQGGKSGIADQGDDCRAILKAIPEGTLGVTFESFDALPQICVLSGSMQYGAGKEPRIAWSKNEHMPLQLLDGANPHPTYVPNVRTREGLRMRWFQEHPSNLIGSGALAGTPHFEEAMLANWNPRAAYNVRSPWENVAGSLPASGSAGGPWFFGAYTRDLYDEAVSWQEETPVPSDGKFHGNPFGQPQEGKKKIVLFDVPRTETGIVSLGQLQHVQLSNFIWHPSYAIGNSLVDPRLGLSTDHTAPTSDTSDGTSKDGFQKDAIGWSNDKQRATSQDSWAANGRAILQNTPATDNLVYDLSYEVNRTLWDRYYLSSGDPDDKQAFLADPRKAPLPNGRLRLAPGPDPTADQLEDYQESAAHFMLDGAFNVNSTRVEAWKAMLASTRKSGFGSGTGQGTPFPRVLNPPGGKWSTGNSTGSEDAWSGYRVLTDDEIGLLATEIVKQVKLRGPFLSMADFVNRRLANDETGRMGPLQAAIEKAGLNDSFQADFPLNNAKSLPDYRHPDNIKDATRLEQTLKPDCKAWGIPGYLTQADVLQVLGPVLSARSDSFVVRAYGDSVDDKGLVKARAWCEAVVQRLPSPMIPDDAGLNPRHPDVEGDFGRRFALVSFRWLNKNEI